MALKWQFYWVKPFLILLGVGCFLFAFNVHAHNPKEGQLEPEDLDWIANRIYQNEVGQNPENLTFWNARELFPSLGIGHFIWIPEGVEVPFIETFPQMVAYVSKEVKPPEWLRQLHPFKPPWPSKKAFDEDSNSPRMNALRHWLASTQRAQAEFIYLSFKQKWLKAVDQLTVRQQKKVSKLMDTLEVTRTGRFIVIDYYNFKGLGNNPKEKYQGKGWGLIDVLKAMPEGVDPSKIAQVFVKTAKETLLQRIQLSPPEKNEHKFMPGWNKRLNSYL